MKTYGTVELKSDSDNPDSKQWHITAEPHIMLRLRRVFERIDKTQMGTVTLAATPENARDLDWFLTRYPLEIQPETRDILIAGANDHRDHILTIEQMIDGDYVPRAFDCPIPPRDYQARAAEITLKQGFLLVADELGLGKTFEAILCFTDPRALPAVVVCYPHLQKQWAAEIAKFAPNLKTHVIKSGKPYTLPKFKDGAGGYRGADVLIITYNKLDGWATVLARYCEGIIFDEIQELRRTDSKKYAAAKHLASACTIRQGLTATPIFNYGAEMFNVLDVLKQGCLGTRAEFYREWCHYAGMDKWIIRDPKAFGTYLRESGFMLRRTRADVGRELPDVIRIPHRVDSDAAALSAVEDSAHELARIIMGRTAESFKGQRLNAAEQLSNMLRQATGIAKAPYVADFVNLLLDSGEPVLLAGWHRAVYNIWASKLEKAGRRVAWYTGTESNAAKAMAKAQFMAGEIDVMMISLRSGAGLDGLQERCRTAVIGELDWSPAVHEQFIGRLNRDGGIPGGVTAYFLLSEEGADPIMAETLGLKREQLEGIRNPQQNIVEKFVTDPNHIKKLAEHYLNKRAGSAPASTRPEPTRLRIHMPPPVTAPGRLVRWA